MVKRILTASDLSAQYYPNNDLVQIIVSERGGVSEIIELSYDQFEKIFKAINSERGLYTPSKIVTTSEGRRGKIEKNKLAKFRKRTVQSWIYTPTSINVELQQRFIVEVIRFMEALGFSLKSENEPIFESWLKRLRFLSSKALTLEDVDRLFEKGKQALELKHVDAPIADNTLKLTEAATNLLNLMKETDSSFLRLGGLVGYRDSLDTAGRINIIQLTSDQVKMLDRSSTVFKTIQELNKWMDTYNNLGPGPQNKREELPPLLDN